MVVRRSKENFQMSLTIWARTKLPNIKILCLIYRFFQPQLGNPSTDVILDRAVDSKEAVPQQQSQVAADVRNEAV